MKGLLFWAAAVVAIVLAGCAPTSPASLADQADRPLVTVFRHPT